MLVHRILGLATVRGRVSRSSRAACVGWLVTSRLGRCGAKHQRKDAGRED